MNHISQIRPPRTALCGRPRATASWTMLADIAIRVQLTPSDYQKAIHHYQAISQWIDREDSPLHGRMRLLYPQGSFMIGATTARHATDADFDIDVIAEINWPGTIDPEVALSTMHHAIRGEHGSRYYEKAERKTRCSTVHYDGNRAIAQQRCPMSRSGILMKLTAAHEPPGDVGRLQFGAFRGRMGREIAGDSDEDMSALVGIAPLAELPHAGVQHLVGMEPCVLAQ
jgi:hypothetical protein